MRLKFKVQQYQTDATDAACDAFEGQPNQGAAAYLRDLGTLPARGGMDALFDSVLSTATLIGMIVAKFAGVYVEGYLGIAIGLFILSPHLARKSLTNALFFGIVRLWSHLLICSSEGSPRSNGNKLRFSSLIQ